MIRSLRTRYAGWLAPGDLGAMVVGSALVLGTLASFWILATRTSPDIWVPVLIIGAVVIISLPLIRLVTKAPADRRLRYLLLVTLLLKLAASFARYYVNEVSYGGEADSGQYHITGQVFIENLHEGRWTIEGSPIDGLTDETRLVGYITGLLYTVIGPTYMGGFLVYAWMCWLGLLLFFQAFRLVYPNAPPLLPASLLFLLPSTLYWPSSIGKDTLMVLALGAVTYGLARLFVGRGRLLGLAAIVPAASLILAVRPHLLMVVLVGVAASLVAKNAADTRALSAVLGRVLVLALLIPLLFLGMGRMDDFFGDTSSSGVSSALERTAEQTSVGGSAFETRSVTNPIEFPVAVISVVYRPFIFEASGIALISAIEGSVLMALTVVAGRWLWRIGPEMYRNQFAAYCGAYVLAFVFAFSNIGNAGILARQRVQMFPVLMILAMAAREQGRRHVESIGSSAAADVRARGALEPV